MVIRGLTVPSGLMGFINEVYEIAADCFYGGDIGSYDLSERDLTRVHALVKHWKDERRVNVTKDRVDLIKRLAKGHLRDHDLDTKMTIARDQLVKEGYIDRAEDWNFLTAKGIRLAKAQGFLPDSNPLADSPRKVFMAFDPGVPGGDFAPKSGEGVLQEADRITSEDRRKLYGSAVENFTGIAKAFNAATGHKVTPAEVGLFNIIQKICREGHCHKRDNMVDIAGYAKLVQQVHDHKDCGDAPPSDIKKQ